MNLKDKKKSENYYPKNESTSLQIISKNWGKNIELFKTLEQPQALKLLNITLDLKIAKRIVDRVGYLKRKIFKNLEVVIFYLVLEQNKLQKQIDFNELNRIGLSLKNQSEKNTLSLKIVHSFDQYTLTIKQIRFQKKILKTKQNEQQGRKAQTKENSKVENIQKLALKQTNKKTGIKEQEEFYIHLKNIKQKITLPFMLKEQTMINYNNFQDTFSDLFCFNQYLLKQTQKIFPIISIDSINIGEIDLSKDISASFIVFLNSFLSQIDSQKIKSLSFKAKQSFQQQSLLKEYLFIFSKFLQKCTELCQIQIILDFNNIEISQFSNMFKHLVLSILSSDSRKDLQILDLSFSNIGSNNSQILKELSIAEFIQNKIDKLKSLNVRFYSGDSYFLLLADKQKNSNNLYLNFFMQNNKLGVEEFLNEKLVRHLKLEFKGSKELKPFAKKKIDFSQVLLFANSKGTIETLSKSLGEEQLKSQLEGNSVTQVDLFHMIQENQIDEIWVILINELFMNCKKSIQSILCNIQFYEGLQSKNLKQNDTFLIEKLTDLKTQQRRPFEQMIINFLQPINYKILKRVEVKNTIYDITFNKLLLQSICICKLDYFEVSQTVKVDYISSLFLLKLTNQTQEFLNLMPNFAFKKVKLQITSLNADFLEQTRTIIQKSRPKNIIQSIEIDLDFDKKFEANKILEFIDLLKSINQIKLITRFFMIEISPQKIVFKQSQLDFQILRFLQNFNSKQLCLYIDYQNQYAGDQKLEVFKHFKFLSIFISNKSPNTMNTLNQTQILLDLKNLHKVVFQGTQNFKDLVSQKIQLLLNRVDRTKIIDVFCKKNIKGKENFISKTKIIKILQLLQLKNKNSQLRHEIIQEIITSFLI